MKSMQFKVDMLVAGVPHGPDDDPIMLDNDAADALIAAGEAEEADDLDAKTIADLTALAEAEGAPLGDSKRKAEITAAIRAHRSAGA